MKVLSIATILAVLICCNAEVIDLTDSTAWNKHKQVTFKEKTIISTNKVFLKGSKIFDIDPAKKYTIKLTATSKNVPATVFVAFIPLGSSGEELSTTSFHCLPNTLTQVAVDAKKGDKKIMVKSGANWKVRSASAVMKNAKADNSDIPNKNQIAHTLTSVVQKGDLWELSFQYPLTADVKAGEFIRQHQGGGYLYFGGIKTVNPNKETVMKGTITGRAVPGLYRFTQWPHNVNKARLALLLDWGNKKATIEIKDATLTIE